MDSQESTPDAVSASTTFFTDPEHIRRQRLIQKLIHERNRHAHAAASLRRVAAALDDQGERWRAVIVRRNAENHRRTIAGIDVELLRIRPDGAHVVVERIEEYTDRAANRGGRTRVFYHVVRDGVCVASGKDRAAAEARARREVATI